MYLFNFGVLVNINLKLTTLRCKNLHLGSLYRRTIALSAVLRYVGHLDNNLLERPLNGTVWLGGRLLINYYECPNIVIILKDSTIAPRPQSADCSQLYFSEQETNGSSRGVLMASSIDSRVYPAEQAMLLFKNQKRIKGFPVTTMSVSNNFDGLLQVSHLGRRSFPVHHSYRGPIEIS